MDGILYLERLKKEMTSSEKIESVTHAKPSPPTNNGP